MRPKSVNMTSSLGETKAQLYEAQQGVVDMEETVSDIQGVNMVINETLKVQEKMIENLREDLSNQEDIEVTEIGNTNNVESGEIESRSCKQCVYVAEKKRLHEKPHDETR